ncbi:hypothetical protein [Balneicella halophila]|uniref:hypothetical protein n=1 Tax=Balneicella halophila TaxID=1537566 RepID=UPI000E30A936|nr:hypothetical protein [Balneicella halophila]
MWEYNTERYISIPIYEIANIDNVINDDSPSIKNYVYGDINGFQLKDNYRIDAGYTFQIKGKKYAKHILKTGIYSLVGKAAPFRATSSVFEGEVNIEEVALPSPMPYVSYTFKF